MSQLQHLHLDRDMTPRLPGNCLHGLGIMNWDAAAELASAVGAATQLTSLFVGVYTLCPGGNHDDFRSPIWEEQLRHLQRLQRLSFGLELRPEDLPHFSQLTALTALELSKASYDDFGDSHFEVVCRALPQLRELTASKSGMKSAQDAFAAVAPLTDLRSLSFEGNGRLAQGSPYRVTLWELWPLTQLTRLVLPAVTYDECSQAYLRGRSHAKVADCAGSVVSRDCVCWPF